MADPTTTHERFQNEKNVDFDLIDQKMITIFSFQYPKISLLPLKKFTSDKEYVVVFRTRDISTSVKDYAVYGMHFANFHASFPGAYITHCPDFNTRIIHVNDSDNMLGCAIVSLMLRVDQLVPIQIAFEREREMLLRLAGKWGAHPSIIREIKAAKYTVHKKIIYKHRIVDNTDICDFFCA